jgi:hypothetical protein
MPSRELTSTCSIFLVQAVAALERINPHRSGGRLVTGVRALTVDLRRIRFSSLLRALSPIRVLSFLPFSTRPLAGRARVGTRLIY